MVSGPRDCSAARFENDHLAVDIARRTAEEFERGRRRDAASLLFARRHVEEHGSNWRWRASAAGAGDRAWAAYWWIGPMRSLHHSGAEDALRHIFTLKLATVREDGEPTRRRAFRHEFSDDEWRLVSDLADHPNRLIVTATTEATAPVADTARDNANVVQTVGETTYAEVAHEAIFRRWGRLREWIAAEREFLAWRSGLEAARRAFAATPDQSKNDALLMGFALAQAKRWLTKRREDLSADDRKFIDQSAKVAQTRRMRLQGPAGVVVVAMIVSSGRLNQDWLEERLYVLRNVNVVTAAQEKPLKPGDHFRNALSAPR